MKISALALQGMRGWPDVEVTNFSTGLNVISGPEGSGKTTVAELLSHVLFGKLPASTTANCELAPEGEATVGSNGSQYRVRRYHDGTRFGRLTVASLGDEPVDSDTVQHLVGGLSPDVLRRFYAASFTPDPKIDGVAAGEFIQAYQSIVAASQNEPGRRAAELAARRDELAHELETRIAGERRISGELEQRRRELDRLIRDTDHSAAGLELRLRAVETALAETDARLRYRRLELNVELRWQADEPSEFEPELAELEAQIARWRTTQAEMSQREASVRSRLAQLNPAGDAKTALRDQRAWMAVARQLAADLDGEVARLARASASQQCVCTDAHPRLRPIVETLSRQLDYLAALIETQQRAATAGEWSAEAEHLSQAQAKLRKQVDHLLDRRQKLVDAGAPRRPFADALYLAADNGDGSRSFSAADAEQLEQRRLELEQQRFELVEAIRTRRHSLRELREERADLDRQRAALLSARSIEHVQRELSAVQRKLEFATSGGSPTNDDRSPEGAWRASDFLAQLTGGRIVRLEAAAADQLAWAIRETGERVPLESLMASERDQVCLSLVLAVVSAAARKGVHLPLILDDPFVRLDERGTSALAAVLDAVARQGHQVLLFTGQREAIERLASLGACNHDLIGLRRWKRDSLPTAAGRARSAKRPNGKPSSAIRPARSTAARRKTRRGETMRDGATESDERGAA
jgi:DNA repair exonuclease SbcCD ATPase subunit